MPLQWGIPAALARFGLNVELVPGWETRGRPYSFNPKGSVAHHTAGPATGDRPSLNVCTYGRTGLPGPLCQVFLARSGVAVVVAAGYANHAGTGGWNGLTGNSSVFGCEAEDDGDGNWTSAQLWAFPRVHAAFHSLPGMRGADYCCAHREWTTRKPDPGGIDMPAFRAAVSALLADPTAGDDDLALTADDKAFFLSLTRNEGVSGTGDPRHNGNLAIAVRLDQIIQRLDQLLEAPPVEPPTG